MGATAIEWADHSINPLRARNLETGAVGHFCEKISPTCAHCYAAAWNLRVRPSGTHLIGTGLDFVPENRAKVEIFLDRSKLEEVLRRKKPTAYFWCDMTDLFGEWVPDRMIDECYAVMALTPHHTHLTLTKRADRQLAYYSAPDLYDRILRAASEFRAQRPELVSVGISDPAMHPPRWIYKGVSVENQPFANVRIPKLMLTPAGVRFLSIEALLGPVNLKAIRWETEGSGGPAFVDVCGGTFCTIGGYGLPGPRIDWVIDGGESGSDARPSHPDWFRSIRDQCQAAGVPYFHKQNGAWEPFYDRDKDDPDWQNVPRESEKVKRLNLAGGLGFHGERVVYFRKVGKKAAGRLLDGQEWNEMPEARR